MRKPLKKIMTVTAVLTVFMAGSALYAYADTPDSEAPSDVMQSGQGEMMDMMGMMQQMSDMMTTCNEMMQDMADHGTKTQEKQDLSVENEG